MSEQPHRILVGYDSEEALAYGVCELSMRSCLPKKDRAALHIEPLVQEDLRLSGLYRRPFYVEDQQRYDAVDGRPISTEFSFTRFLVPALCQYRGWALFCDSDFLWREDVRELFALADKRKAVMVVQHHHEPTEATKMRHGQIQTRYDRKNWSSLVLWNCGHSANRTLTPYLVNVQPGWWLHGFRWLEDELIGALPEEWNWLEGYSPLKINPKAVHYTRGTPDLPEYAGAVHAGDWIDYARRVEAA